MVWKVIIWIREQSEPKTGQNLRYQQIDGQWRAVLDTSEGTVTVPVGDVESIGQCMTLP